MAMQPTKSLQRLLRATKPTRLKQEYHGNGDNAWYGDTLTAKCKGLQIEARRYSARHSYRWHKTKIDYMINGELCRDRNEFKRQLKRHGIKI